MRSELYEQLSVARQQVHPKWTLDREQAVWARIECARSRRTKQKQLGFAGLVALALLALGLAWHSVKLEPKPVASLSSSSVQIRERSLLELEDGSTAMALSPAARVEPIEVSASGVTIRLAAGAARFEVAPQSRAFRVVAGEVTVLVIGTVFSVSLDSDEVRVEVEHGRVRVNWPGGERELLAGEKTILKQPLRADGASESALPPDSLSPSALPAGDPGVPRAAPRTWRVLAHDGEYGAAFKSMVSDRRAPVRDEPEDLLLAADVARLSGHPERSIGPLQRMVTRHAGDARAPLAAFTLGRVLLDQLGRPHEAAQAFASARHLAPGGALAQDALAREVESWSRAGEADFARARAQEFVKLYSGSRREKMVRRHGGLD